MKKLLYKAGGHSVDAYGNVYTNAFPVDSPDGFYYRAPSGRWEHCRKVEVCIQTVVVDGNILPVRYRFVGLQTESGHLVPCERNEFLSGHNIFELDSCEDVEFEESSLKVVDMFAAKKAGWKSPQERADWLDYERLAQ